MPPPMYPRFTLPQHLPSPPGEALAKLFLANADRGANAANDLFMEELLKRRRVIQALANPSGPAGATTAS